jgi:hypothetical protein
MSNQRCETRYEDGRDVIIKWTEIFYNSVCKNFIQPTYKINMCFLTCEMYNMF